MIDIITIRGAGDIPGEDIVDTLVVTESVAVPRGRNEIDKNAKITPVALSSKYRAGLETGQTVQILDALQGASWLGKITNIDIAVEGVALTANLQVERV